MSALTAHRVGSLVPTPPWDGTIVSIYPRAFNLRLAAGLLVGFVAHDRQMSPYSILAPDLFNGNGSMPFGIVRGEVARASASTIAVGSHTVDLLSASIWSGELPSGISGTMSDTGACLQRVEAALSEAGARDGLLEVVLQTDRPTIFGKRAREIVSAVRREGTPGRVVVRGLASLVGLGIGFTPSGDDFLSGAFLAQALTRSAGGTLDSEEIRSVLSKTNDGGRTLLTGVLEQQFPQYLLRLGERLVEANGVSGREPEKAQERVTEAVREAASHGETSGTDAVAGVAWYLRQAASRFSFD